MTPYKQTELDTQLRELALTDWPRFIELMGEDAINKAKICLMKRQGRTIRYMAFRVKMPQSTTGLACQRCPDK
jgi:hypothetical protein